MKLLPAKVRSAMPSLNARSCCTCGASSLPNAAVAMRQPLWVWLLLLEALRPGPVASSTTVSERYWSESATSEYVAALYVCSFSVIAIPNAAAEPAGMSKLPRTASASAFPIAITLPFLSYRVAIIIAFVASSCPSFLACGQQRKVGHAVDRPLVDVQHFKGR